MKVVNLRVCIKCKHEYNAANGTCDRCNEETEAELVIRKVAEAKGMTIAEYMEYELTHK